MPDKKIKVLLAGAELAPLAKVGGLGDVMGSLPPALKKIGVDARVIMPLYGSIDKKKHGLKKIYSDLEVPSGLLMLKVNLWQAKLPGSTVVVYFVDCPQYFSYPGVYAPGDNSERFLFFSLAMLYALPLIGFKPDVLHLHDSHVALAANILKVSQFQFLQGIKTLFTIHNFNYQGKTKTQVLSTGNLSPQLLKTLSVDARDGDINFMVQGVLNADLINTVSPTYAREIMTSVYGAGLDNVIQKRKSDLYGILNGIDEKAYNPKTDRYIARNYSSKTLSKKTENKIALQKKLGLPQDPKKAIVGLVSRLVWQKGIDLVTDNFRHLNCQFVFLGTGQPEYEKHLKALAQKYPRQFSANIYFDIGLAQLIYAASDFFLMPSRFEPCGLGQMFAMRYGTLPIARTTGGLADTVDRETGFLFKNVSKSELYSTIKNALDLYYHQPEHFEQMQRQAMARDFSWNKSAKEYVGLYRKLIG